MTTAGDRRAYVVIDLGFGDAGKGLLTDFLVRRTGATLVVRHGGGAQAGHNVVTRDGRHHTFAQFGAGTFVPGVRTFLSRNMVIHPGALLLEGEALQKKGVEDAFSRLRISESARVITPFHQAANRLREIARGAARHGSCGVGVGEVVADSLAFPEETVLAGDVRDAARLREKLRSIQVRKRGEVDALPGSLPGALERGAFESADIIDRWIEQVSPLATLGLIVPDALLAEWLGGPSPVVFEGAQGVLLDEWCGFHPHTTWTSCTAEPALSLLRESGFEGEVVRVGVLRSHAVRHGAGPLPSETAVLGPLISEHNSENPWQGRVRYGWFDAVLARYALEVVGGVEALAITHVDALARAPEWRICAGYEGASLSAPTGRSIEAQERMGEMLTGVTPRIEMLARGEEVFLERVEALLGRGVDIVSRGPRAEDVEIRSAVLGRP